MDTLELRPTTNQDLTSLLIIERLSYQSPWDVHTFLSVLTEPRCRNVTASEEDRIVGFCLSQSLKNMVHLLNLAVHPDFRRRGVARAMLEDIISFARTSNKSYVFLEVRKSNEGARALYDSMGFSHVCTWRRYYTDSGEDACVMAMKNR